MTSLPSAHSFGITDTLLDTGRVIRLPFEEWVPEICAKLESAGSIEDTWAALNNAALVFVYARQPELARDICTHQLQWAGQNELPELAIQPWINLGRLCRRAGHYEAALTHFCGADDRFSASAFIYETIRTYIQMGDLDRALSFAVGLREPLEPAADLLRTELMIQLLLKQRSFTLLPALMKKSCWPRDAFGVMTKHLYACAILCATGQKETAASGQDRLLPHVAAWIDRPASLESRDIRLAIASYRLTKHSRAWSTALKAVMKSRDVLYAADLLNCSGSEDTTTLSAFVDRFNYNAPSHSSVIMRLSRAIAAVLDGALCDVLYAH